MKVVGGFMKSVQRPILIPAAALIALAATPAHGQRPPSPEQRMLMLEQQLAASQAAAIRLEQRLGAIERQLQQLINQNEVSGHRVSVLESDIAKLRADIDQRLTALESRPAVMQSSDTAPERVSPVQPNPRQTATATEPRAAESTDASPSDPGEDAYSLGFRLWRDGKYDEAITALRAFTAGFPNHRRVSFANNLIGRALLDDGKPRPAAEAFLANYRADPKGERAPDSLYYLGQSLMRLNQPTQACKAYSELESVYGPSIRADLNSLVAEAKAEANCS
jgi:TolA-binding protein